MGSLYVQAAEDKALTSGAKPVANPQTSTGMPPSIDSALDTQDLANEQRGLLDLVDKLQFAQLDNVKLPQIVVVGDQSAGKSSVLEAITGTPFPRDAGACTRFASEIRLRRSNESSLTVTIIPDKNRPFRDQEKLRQFGGGVDANTPFDTLMRYAVDLIAPKNIPGRFAARDILVVEKRGPDMPLLTLVDLPGLVKNANNDQSLEDIKTIESLCDRYMKSSRTIILAVVGGNSDYVQAPILTKARQFDPTGARTIGVLTKPDLTESIGLEDKFIDLVNNKDKANIFKLGWYVLLNPGPREPNQPWPTAFERRQREEEFFGRGKWRALPESMCGATALKQKLSVQLQRHIGKHVKTLRKQIQKALDDCEAELKSLGTGKDTPEEMRVELVELFSSSKELVIPAVYGFYKNPPRKNFFRVTADPRGTPAQNLRARAAEENDRFAHRIRQHGRKFGFASGPNGRSQDGADMGDAGKSKYVRQEVQALLQQVRGSEFPGDAKPRAVYMLFQNYSENWPTLAQEHKDNLGVVCNEFLSELIDYAWPKRMHEPLRRHFLDPQMKGLMEKAQKELDLLVQDMHLEVQPYDPEYEERLKQWHVNVTQDGGSYSEAQEVLEKMLIYYELSAKSFIRNIITQVVERHLLQGMYGVFNSVEILGMTNETVEAIAAENKQTRDKRMTLKAQKKAIEEAKDICANLAMRKELRMYADEGDNDEETSDEEGMSRQGSRSPTTPKPPTSSNGPSLSQSSRRQQRSSRQSYEEPPQASPSRPEAPSAAVHGANYIPSGQGSEQNYAASTPRVVNDPSEGYYTQNRAPTSAPPPPPRPDKVRTAESFDSYSTTPDAQLHREQRPTAQSGPEQYYNPASRAGSSGYSLTAQQLREARESTRVNTPSQQRVSIR
ncbi:putative interferon-induced gtp-binding protein mx protein [Phaeoacremonium minimum UCRPA7]|uniref:Putative interferon-induced gtp-binding protein mx protein n=1 Tax=Phaeoacremonium minimum (strain UCR-PA7) TaxID=1286976 RepID=R8BCV8_PHAM7|nr:putative interferon-induced gtp-binding protein mx protein [Phaeoacremonium minimum UCRPA7]EON97122.1 putative interferon-induced gtp-binding protein mx protein [Phaeoacremonium minimum UCRPA7]